MTGKLFYFVDTRDNAKSKEPFGISNPDVAKSWKSDFNAGEGPFEAVDAPEFDEEFEEMDNGKGDEGDKVGRVEPSLYDEMDKAELRAELDARMIEYKKNGPESTNDFLIKQLVEDDNQ